MKATRLVHQLAGRPEAEGAVQRILVDEEAVCAVCGNVEARTAQVDRALGANFTDRSMFARPDSDRVCAACVAVCSGKPPRTFRMWSVVATPGRALPPSQEKAAAWIGQHDGLCLTSRADTTPIVDTLLNPPEGPWVVSVATSGQKHVVLYAEVNEGARGIVRMEATDVPYSVESWVGVWRAALDLRRLGVPADDILLGRPRYLHSREDLNRWAVADGLLQKWHRSPLLNLALWTITKGICDATDRYPND